MAQFADAIGDHDDKIGIVDEVTLPSKEIPIYVFPQPQVDSEKIQSMSRDLRANKNQPTPSYWAMMIFQ